MVVKLRVKIDWNNPKEQPETIYFYRDRIEAETISPCGCGSNCGEHESHRRTLSYDDWFLMNDTMRIIMGKSNGKCTDKCSEKCCD